jgi:AraC family transcriptional regulator of adaptative response / methylphosphotriester-DNA alkyltransferase methyltransferase
VDDEQKWQAAVECDPAADGLFFYAVKTVGVFCRPSCKSRTPLRKNTVFFADTATAVAAGFRACKRCRPDLLEYAPALEIAEQTKGLIDALYDRRRELADQMRQIGLSQAQLARVFKAKFGMTPVEYANRVRLDRAKELLNAGQRVAEVAWEVGFDSLSAFYRFFTKHAGVAPKAFQQNEVMP